MLRISQVWQQIVRKIKKDCESAHKFLILALLPTICSEHLQDCLISLVLFKQHHGYLTHRVVQ